MLLTGRIVQNSLVQGNSFVPQQTNLTMSFPNVLKRIGYDTAVIGKYGFGVPGDFYSADKMGFNYFYGYGTHDQAHYPFPRYVYKNEKIIQFSNNALSTKTKCLGTKKCTFFPDLIHDDAINFINIHDIDKPFFLMWCPIATHVGRWAKSPRMASDVTNTFGPFKNFPWSSQAKGYAYSLFSIDRDIGDLLKILEIKRIENNTIIILASDNGAYTEGGGSYFFGSTGGRRGSKGSMYEGGLSVPFIIKYPNFITPGTSYYPFAFHDIPKTLLDLIKAPSRIISEFAKVDNSTVSFIRVPDRMWLKTINCENGSVCENSTMNVQNWTYSLPKLIFDGSLYSFFDIKKDPRELVNLVNDKKYVGLINFMKAGNGI
jgi:arylsulfatase A-like enzyme